MSEVFYSERDNAWVVERILPGQDGQIARTVFTGWRAEARARAYALLCNCQEPL